MNDLKELLSVVPDVSIVGLLLWLLFDTRKRNFACHKELRETLREIAGMRREGGNGDLE